MHGIIEPPHVLMYVLIRTVVAVLLCHMFRYAYTHCVVVIVMCFTVLYSMVGVALKLTACLRASVISYHLMLSQTKFASYIALPFRMYVALHELALLHITFLEHYTNTTRPTPCKPLHYVTLQYIMVCYVAQPCVALCCATLRWIAVGYDVYSTAAYITLPLP